jgi:Cu/Ag efflux protein CusF
MREPLRRALKPYLALACVAALLPAVACGRARKGHDYTVRAMVVQPPDPSTGLYIYHEAIDNWVGHDGKVEGMDPMAMPFPVAQGVSLSGLQANDKVEVTLHADWEADTPVQITSVRKLSPDTKLEFRAAKPPQNP